MENSMLIPQIIMGITLILMLSGKAPIYLTAFIGSVVSLLFAGVAISSNLFFGLVPAAEGQPVLAGFFSAGLHSVILDMVGVLLFIGIMENVGYLNAIIIKIMHFGKNVGGGPGIATAGGIAAGVIGGMTGFTQPAITAVVTGPPAVDMGVDKNKVAGVLAHAGHLGNFGGFTHPTLVAVIAAAGLGFGLINIFGAIVALSIFAASFVRLKKEMKNKPAVNVDAKIETTDIPLGKAAFPFIVLIVSFIIGVPVILSGIIAALLVVIMTTKDFSAGEKIMMDGLKRITVPLFATISFLFMSSVIGHIGIVDFFADLLAPILSINPVLIMLLVSSITALLTQSNGASAAVVVPFLMIVLETGANPLAAAVAAAGGAAIMQYWLTGGPVAALSTVIPVIDGSDLKLANKFQRPSIAVGMLVLAIISLTLSFF